MAGGRRAARCLCRRNRDRVDRHLAGCVAATAQGVSGRLGAGRRRLSDAATTGRWGEAIDSDTVRASPAPVLATTLLARGAPWNFARPDRKIGVGVRSFRFGNRSDIWDRNTWRLNLRGRSKRLKLPGTRSTQQHTEITPYAGLTIAGQSVDAAAGCWCSGRSAVTDYAQSIIRPSFKQPGRVSLRFHPEHDAAEP